MAQTFPFPEYQNGVVREAAVDEVIAPQNSVELAVNVHFDRIGAVTRRLGTTLLGDQIASSTAVLGLAPFAKADGTSYAILAKVGTSVYSNNGGSWTVVRTGVDASSKMRTTNFVDYTFMVNGSGNQVCSTWGGSGSFGSTNVASLPRGDFIENYRSRIWVGQSTTDKVYYSDVVSTSNTITGGTAFIQVSPQDGDRMTGLKRHYRALLVFKQNHIYKITSINAVDPDPAIMRGTYSQESIVEAKDGIYYHHSTGFYKFAWEGEQEEISRPIIDIIQAIPRASYDNVVGWADDDHVYWSVGDVTVSGITITNAVCRRTISTKIWTIYSYPKQFRSAAVYDNGTTLVQLVGDSNGNVLKFNTGNTDNGTAIYYDMITHWSYFTTQKSQTKGLSKLGVLHENAHGMNIAHQVDSNNQKNTNNAWNNDGEIAKDIYDEVSIGADNFTRLRIRTYGNSSGTPFILRSFEGIDMTGISAAQ